MKKLLLVATFGTLAVSQLPSFATPFDAYKKKVDKKSNDDKPRNDPPRNDPPRNDPPRNDPPRDRPRPSDNDNRPNRPNDGRPSQPPSGGGIGLGRPTLPPRDRDPRPGNGNGRPDRPGNGRPDRPGDGRPGGGRPGGGRPPYYGGGNWNNGGTVIVDRPVYVPYYNGPLNDPFYNGGQVYGGTVIGGPVYNGPIYNPPVYNDPVYNEPVYNDPGYDNGPYDDYDYSRYYFDRAYERQLDELEVIARQIKTALRLDPVLEPFKLDTDTVGESIEIEGYVDTPSQLQRVLDVARSIHKDVRIVITRVRLR